MYSIRNICSITTHFSTISAALLPKVIHPESKEWNFFLEMNYSYMQESWPKQWKHIDQLTFIKTYSLKLIKRIKEGDRGLFLYYSHDNPVGFSNVYLTRKKTILNIAEFYIKPEWRRKKFGNEMLNHVIAWGKEQGAEEIRIEVDKDLQKANCFWSSFGCDLDSSGSRNVYLSRI